MNTQARRALQRKVTAVAVEMSALGAELVSLCGDGNQATKQSLKRTQAKIISLQKKNIELGKRGL